MEQAAMTATHYMLKAQEAVHRIFGRHYCERNPAFTAALIAAYMQTAAADFDSSVRAGVLDK